MQYWDKRYKKDEEQFDWYQRYDTLKHILDEVTPKSMDRILMVGCGNSSTLLPSDANERIGFLNSKNFCCSLLRNV